MATVYHVDRSRGNYVTEEGRVRKYVTGLLSDDSLSCRHLGSSSYHRCGETALTPHCSPTPRRTGSPERRSHAGRTCAGGASAAAGGHRAQTGTVPPLPRPVVRAQAWALLLQEEAAH